MDMLNIDEIQDVWMLASKFHDGQKYGSYNKGEQIEYINHIGSVAYEIIAVSIIEKKINLDLALKCAILHDTIEDTKLTYNEIVDKYGFEVGKGVLALTKDSRITCKKERMMDSLNRIKQCPKEVWAVKIADRITNLYAPPFPRCGKVSLL